jgi:hypothetical protein
MPRASGRHGYILVNPAGQSAMAVNRRSPYRGDIDRTGAFRAGALAGRPIGILGLKAR